MSQTTGPGPYRVRPAVEQERTVPIESHGPRFHSRNEAELYAGQQRLSLKRPMLLEKLAPGGCWLQLAMLG
jgi:hypothetical protein